MQIPVRYVGIVGSRSLSGESIRNFIAAYLTDHRNYPGIVVVSGGADGVDTEAVEVAKELHLDYMVYEAQWGTLGPNAGKIRNQYIVDDSDELLIIWDEKSPGTKDTLRRTRKAKKPHFLYIPGTDTL